MKPGMQRDILVAFWLLFDEFEIGEDDAPQPPDDAATAGQSTTATPTATASSPPVRPSGRH